ncbi:hypothetical protein KY290_007732 [Solanum tuberosum]|uniref:RNase H type-1 domain-containing protein n=1 Tax=Solanum tuberosum TaxID=4113 RepID=A0ABQ7W6E2_SOLTU|nr:hypothetical protein KY290_007732 [Solanum tuberosum]
MEEEECKKTWKRCIICEDAESMSTNGTDAIENGTCRGNPGQSSYGFSIRDTKGDLIYAEAQCIGEATNMEAELMGVWKALPYCDTKNF